MNVHFSRRLRGRRVAVRLHDAARRGAARERAGAHAGRRPGRVSAARAECGRRTPPPAPPRDGEGPGVERVGLPSRLPLSAFGEGVGGCGSSPALPTNHSMCVKPTRASVPNNPPNPSGGTRPPAAGPAIGRTRRGGTVEPVEKHRPGQRQKRRVARSKSPRNRGRGCPTPAATRSRRRPRPKPGDALAGSFARLYEPMLARSGRSRTSTTVRTPSPRSTSANAAAPTAVADGERSRHLPAFTPLVGSARTASQADFLEDAIDFVGVVAEVRRL